MLLFNSIQIILIKYWINSVHNMHITVPLDNLLLLPNTDHLQQVDDHIRPCSSFTTYTDHLQQVDDHIRGCSSCTKLY